MEIYGVDRWYLNIDSDELFTPDFKDIHECIDNAKLMGYSAVKSMLVDVYSKKLFLVMIILTT